MDEFLLVLLIGVGMFLFGAFAGQQANQRHTLNQCQLIEKVVIDSNVVECKVLNDAASNYRF